MKDELEQGKDKPKNERACRLLFKEDVDELENTVLEVGGLALGVYRGFRCILSASKG